MPKTKQQKQQVLKNINEKLDSSNSVIVSVFDKLSVNKDQELRSDLRKENVSHSVVKKTLLKKSFEDKKINELPEEELLRNITLSASEDEVIGAKILAKFSKENEDFKILGGLLNKVWVDANKIKELASLPSKPELIAKTIGTIKAPISGFANVLSGNLRNLVNVLNNIKSDK